MVEWGYSLYFTVMQDKCLKSHQTDEQITYRDLWDSETKFRIVSRASDTPKLWRDMTDAEKGVLLLAHHEGEVIENTREGDGKWFAAEPCWGDNYAYRIKPEPVRETVGLYAGLDRKRHPLPIGTIDLIDGEPDCASVKMEEL